MTATILTTINAESHRREGYETAIRQWIAENPPPPGVKMYGSHPQLRMNPKTGRYDLAGLEAGHEEEGERWHEAWRRASQEAWVKGEAAQGAGQQRDWRPLCSYVGNLERLADQLLDTDGAWVTIGRATERPRAFVSRALGPGGRPLPAREPAPVYERRLADRLVPQYPWVWSAGVLAVLLGLSTWILTRRVKSLDRLR
jgi:hypothetical protein